MLTVHNQIELKVKKRYSIGLSRELFALAADDPSLKESFPIRFVAKSPELNDPFSTINSIFGRLSFAVSISQVINSSVFRLSQMAER